MTRGTRSVGASGGDGGGDRVRGGRSGASSFVAVRPGCSDRAGSCQMQAVSQPGARPAGPATGHRPGWCPLPPALKIW
jgi:hypothetical protein